MKQKQFINDYIQVADLHASRLCAAINHISPLIPINADEFKLFGDEQIAFLDMASTRFGKLQDIIGARIFPFILESLAEDAPSFIDKLTKLEKLGYLADYNWWMQLREIRNQVAHDYPNDYAILAVHFNQLINYSEALLTYWSDLKKMMKIII
jgi:hypothetical protein